MPMINKIGDKFCRFRELNILAVEIKINKQYKVIQFERFMINFFFEMKNKISFYYRIVYSVVYLFVNGIVDAVEIDFFFINAHYLFYWCDRSIYLNLLDWIADTAAATIKWTSVFMDRMNNFQLFWSICS